MTRADDLKRAVDRLNDRRGKGGKTRLAKLLKWDCSTLWRKLNGKSPIFEDDILAAEAAASKATRKRGGAA